MTGELFLYLLKTKLNMEQDDIIQAILNDNDMLTDWAKGIRDVKMLQLCKEQKRELNLLKIRLLKEKKR